MKKLLLRLALLCCGANSYAQSDLHCATDYIMQKRYAAHPEIKQQQDANNKKLKQHTANRTASAGYTIPIVFHILHQGGPENISDAQIIDAVRILNRDFAKQNPDTSEIIPSFKAIADSTRIHFVLATKDTNGNCTNGIIHYVDTDADWNDASPTLYSHTWNPTRYLNVYVVRTITMSNGFSAAGYTYFPGTWNAGAPQDAIVVLNNYLGSIGTSSNLQSRVLTHETGHWFNLYHVFGSTNGAAVDCSGDDYVNDTPTTPGYLICPDKNVPSSYQQCTPGMDENFQNYMDYSYCCRMFTQGQAVRMQAAVTSSVSGRNNLWTTGNLMAAGVINPGTACVPIADFKYDRAVTCTGTAVKFSDASWNGLPSSFNWSFPGGIPATSISSTPVVVYNAPGIYTVSYTCANNSGTATSVVKTDIINVTDKTARYKNYWLESFENAPLPNNDWIITNSSGGANWVQSSDAAFSGQYSAEIPLKNQTRRAMTTMISPAIDLSSFFSPNHLTFELATAESNPNHVNTLKVFSSIDCGGTWTELYSKTGAALVTNTTNVSPFIPTNSSDWRMETINVSNLKSATYATFKFVYIRDTIPVANNIFIDDIAIEHEVGMNSIPANNYSFHLFPNPAPGIINIEFELAQKHNVKIMLRDAVGRTVETIVNNELYIGSHQYKVGEEKRIAPGIYFINMAIDSESIIRKIVIE